MASPVAPQNKRFPLFGYPIAHSSAPGLHNTCFDALKSGNRYELWPTSKITDDVLEFIKSDEFGGCAVTMPNKAAIIPHLDEVSPETQVTDACNTIVKVRTENGFKFVGQNTDILGVRNALLNALRDQYPGKELSSQLSFSVRGGATTRSAAHALTLLGLSPIFLINRDPEEVRIVMEAMPHLSKKGGLIHLKNPDDVEKYLVGPDAYTLVMAVGAIPAIAPVTYAERMVYTTVMAASTIPYKQPTSESGLPLPIKRIFLEMPYKPRRTPMLQIAEATGWHVINGVQAMIEQGLAQQRMWYSGIATVEAGSDTTILSKEIEDSARQFAEEMKEIIVHDKEVDRAAGKDAGTVPKK
ncbi:uncharacterized protein EV420DRAFT_1580945 [Desarmillaria tabescens]|uniref:Shikimate dehydrogenase substrate binding N-terminal domain-containing protein n=1 Tax=Armillaria tabescens TaxID=1929756 RepID=A0AA39MN52_ARMTA|nr:uncharacterized protein EV420DRAFT_1580945 [Desarmillaria tabescens]KAK0440926.1 hypothetical protein EV420DRAFT_1580945 [Desarmillaria tabescens]